MNLPRVNLGTRVFLLTVFLLVLALGSAMAVTLWIGNQIAERAVREAVSKSLSVQATFQQKRFEQLGFIARIFASDPYITAYLAEAAESIDAASILDQLQQRQEDLGYDFAIVLDGGGRVVARTDDPDAIGEDLSDRSLVSMALEENQGFGVWKERNRLYNAVAVPLVRDFDLFGYLVTGYAIDDGFAREVQNLTSAQIVFLTDAPPSDASSIDASGANGVSRVGRIVASTFDSAGANELVRELRANGALGQVLETADQRELELEGERWLAVAAPLRDAAEEPVGTTLVLASLDRELVSYRRILQVLIGVGLAAMLLALLLSWALSRMTMRPIRRLVEAVEGARRGDYTRRLGIKRSDEVGRLADAFDGLIGELGEKEDMAEYIASVRRNLPEPSSRPAILEPRVCEMALLMIENRSYSGAAATHDPGETLTRLNLDLRRAVAAVGAHSGSVESLMGHRLLASFEGVSPVHRAMAAASQVLTELSVPAHAFEDVEPPLLVISAGEAVSGSAVFGDHPERALAGPAVREVESLLREGAPGDVILTRRAWQEVAPAFEEAGLEVPERRGIVSPQPLYLPSAEALARAVEVQAPTATLPEGADPGAPQRTGSRRGGPAGVELGPGSVLGERYDILGVLGAGGMGVVYKARDRELDDLVAIKMLKKAAYGAEEKERLKSEIRLARRITHPNVLRTHDYGELDGVPFISMEYVRGLTLRYMLDQTGRLPFAAGLRLGRQLCAGLGAAHAGGVLHRDIKPENLILEPSGSVRLMDFGIAQHRTTGGERSGERRILVGTPHYLSPEQLRGQEPDERSDLYAVGVVLYEIFVGKLPFSGKGRLSEVWQQHLEQDPVPPSVIWRAIPKELERLLLQLLEKDPEKRVPTAADLGQRLERLGDGPKRRPLVG